MPHPVVIIMKKKQQPPHDDDVPNNKAALTTLTPPQATLDMCVLCFDVLLLKLHQQSCRSGVTSYGNDHLLSGMPQWHADQPDGRVACPLFVTWDKYNTARRYELRGCIGSLQPVTLQQAVPKYALTSALHDQRFAPIAVHEIPALRCKVSLLVQYEPCATVHDWTVGVHGIMIEWTTTHNNNHLHQDATSCSNLAPRRFSATYLPEVALEQGWTVPQAVQSLIRKAGYTAVITPSLLAQIKCTRYQSSKCAMDFAQYATLRQQRIEQQQQQQGQPSTSSLATNHEAMSAHAHMSDDGQAYQWAVAAAAAAHGANTANANCQLM